MEVVKSITSPDGKNRLDIERGSSGLYRYVTFDDRYRNDPDFHAPPDWSRDAYSGLYETAEVAEAEARAKFAWLSD